MDNIYLINPLRNLTRILIDPLYRNKYFRTRSFYIYNKYYKLFACTKHANAYK